MDNIAHVLENMKVDEQMNFIKTMNESTPLYHLDNENEAELSDEEWLEYLIRQDKGVMTMDEFEHLGTKAIQELFI